MKLQVSLLALLALPLPVLSAQHWLRSEDVAVEDKRLLARPDGTLVDLRVEDAFDFGILRVHDHGGDLVSSVRLDPLFGGTARTEDMALFADGDVAVAGTYYSDDESIIHPFVGRFDARTGVADWLVRVPWLGYGYEQVVVSSDAVYVVGEDVPATSMTITRYDHAGTFQWCRNWNVETDYHGVADVCVAPDGGLIVVAEDDDVYHHVLSIDAAGEVAWHRFCDTFRMEAACFDAQGNLRILGRLANQMNLLTLSPAGVELGKTEYFGYETYPEDIVPTDDGGLLLVATRLLGGGVYRPSLLALDAAGNVEWARMYDVALGYSYQHAQEVVSVGERGWVLRCSSSSDNRLLGVAPDGTVDVPCVSVTDLATIAQPATFGPDEPPASTYYVFNQSPEAWIVQPTARFDALELACGAPCSVAMQSIGVGLAGTALITPELDGVGGACFGTPHPRLEVTKGLGGTFGVFGWSRATTSLPILGGTLYLHPQWLVLEPIFLDGAPGAPGAGTWSLEITPDLTGFYGVQLTAQVALLDPGAPEGWSFSPGLHVVVQM